MIAVIEKANALLMQARREAANRCSCGKPAVINGCCRGCDEDRFYGRHIPGAKLEGAE